MGRDRKMTLFWIVIASLAMTSFATLRQDEQECAEQLKNPVACIPFVSGTAKKPTPECCQDTQKVKSSKPRCLCILIKESTDPSIGLPVNTTLALQMPSACNIDAKVSDCPSLLNLPPESADAKIFKEAGSDSSTATTTTDSPTSAPSSGSSSSSASYCSVPDCSSKTDLKAASSSNDASMTKLFGGEIMLVFASLLLFI